MLCTVIVNVNSSRILTVYTANCTENLISYYLCECIKSAVDIIGE